MGRGKYVYVNLRIYKYVYVNLRIYKYVYVSQEASPLHFTQS